MKSGSLNFLEPSGPLQACNRPVLPLPIINKHIFCLPTKCLPFGPSVSLLICAQVQFFLSFNHLHFKIKAYVFCYNPPSHINVCICLPYSFRYVSGLLEVLSEHVFLSDCSAGKSLAGRMRGQRLLIVTLGKFQMTWYLRNFIYTCTYIVYIYIYL